MLQINTLIIFFSSFFIRLILDGLNLFVMHKFVS